MSAFESDFHERVLRHSFLCVRTGVPPPSSGADVDDFDLGTFECRSGCLPMRSFAVLAPRGTDDNMIVAPRSG